MIFSRGGGGGGRHAAEDSRRSGRHSADGPSDEINDDAFGGSGGRDVGSSRAGRAERPVRAARVDRTAAPPSRPAEPKPLERRAPRHDAYTGPYDISEAPVGQLRVDLGSLQIPSIEGVEVRVQANDGVIQQVVLAHGESALQLGAFAAPRTEGIWDEVREEIRKSLFNDGVAAEESAGEFGVELRARVRAPEGMMDLRFIGIDGPRWMLRAVYQGAAAADPSAAGPLDLCLRGLVVDRGRDAMPVRDALPLRLPREMAEQINAGQAAGADTDPDGRGSSTSDGTSTNAASGNAAHGGANGHSVHGSSVRGNPVDDTPMNGQHLGDSAFGPDSESDAAQRRRPSPRPRRPE